MQNEIYKQLALLTKLLTGVGGPKAGPPGVSERELKRAMVRVQEYLMVTFQGKQISLGKEKKSKYILVTEFEGDNMSKLKEEASMVAQQNVMDIGDVEGWAKEYKVQAMISRKIKKMKHTYKMCGDLVEKDTDGKFVVLRVAYKKGSAAAAAASSSA